MVVYSYTKYLKSQISYKNFKRIEFKNREIEKLQSKYTLVFSTNSH